MQTTATDTKIAAAMPPAPTPAPVSPKKIAALSKALAHPARIRIIFFLMSQEKCIGGDIVNEVGLAQSTVSEHLRILKSAGIIKGEIERPRVCYSLNPESLLPLADFANRCTLSAPQSDICSPA